MFKKVHMSKSIEEGREWASEWVLFNANSSISVVSSREQVNFQCDDDEVRSVLTNTLSWMFIVVAHWNNR
jgi:hypothetical protein